MRRSLVAFISVILVVSACAAAVGDPGSTLDVYVSAYNGGDIGGVMELFSEESVVIGHPFDSEARGLTEIRSLQLRDIEHAATENAYTISNVEVTANTVTWDHVTLDHHGVQRCNQGHSAVIEDGKILSWTWPGGGFDCP